MQVPEIPTDEKARLAALHQYRILDTVSEGDLDEIVQLASSIAGTPIALISLVDSDRQWFWSKVGLEAKETPRTISFCGHSILGKGVFEVSDTRDDRRFNDNPLVVGPPNIRFYAGAPLTTPSGYRIGTLCVIDRQPRALTDTQRSVLTMLSRLVITRIELIVKNRELAQRTDELMASVAMSRAAEVEAGRARDVATYNERLTRSIIDTAFDAFIQIDEAGRTLDWNGRAEAIFGWTYAEAIGKPLDELIIPPASRSRHQEGLAPLLSGGGGPVLRRRLEVDSVGRDGKSIPVELAITALQGDRGYVFNAFVRDLTERQATERRIREMQRIEAIGHLTGGMAHDFNNLLGVIIANLDILGARLSSDKASLKMIDSALRGALHGAELIKSLLAFARRQPLAPQLTDLAGPLEAVVSMLRRTVGEDISVVLNLEPRLWTVRIDGVQLESCVVNLGNNARDAMPHGGQLKISSRNLRIDEALPAAGSEVLPGEYVLIEVTDTGAGMTAEVAARAFEPFFSTKTVTQGTGLGLSMVYGFIKQSGGHIRISSAVDRGTTVHIYLPRAGDAKPAAEASPGRPHNTLPAGTETILVVEDNTGMREALATQVASLGYRVIEAENGAMALALLQHQGVHVDLLLSDIVMPGKPDGRELAKLAGARFPQLKILLTSGYSGSRTQEKGADLTSLRVLSKPYRHTDLAQALRATLDG